MTGDKAVTVEHARGKLGALARLAATRGTITVISVTASRPARSCRCPW